MTAGLMPGQGLGEGARAGEPRPAETEAEWETRWTILPCSPAPALSPSAKVQAYIRMFLLSELASPVGNATGIRDEKDTWWESWREITTIRNTGTYSLQSFSPIDLITNLYQHDVSSLVHQLQH